MTHRSKIILSFLPCLLLAACFQAFGQPVKRVLVVKVDGLPGHYVDKYVTQRDPNTGKSLLPWIEEVFYKNGTRVPNFYTRGMSLSGPSWGQIDSGQPMQLKGNVEYDRFTMHAYDYLNFLPYYVDYGLGKKVDMPAMEVMDQLGIPILADAFDYQKRYTSQQLFQRGNSWDVLASGFVKLYPGNARDLIDEWTIGLNFRKMTINQAERDILGKLVKRPDIDYFDYYDVSFDHISHHNNDTASRLAALKEIDRTIGRFWVAIKASSRADETAIVLVSDHGTNSDERVYSQGFNLVRLFGGYSGGGHHVVTKRRLMLDYSIKGINPFAPLIRTPADPSNYLRGQHNEYPTALLDFDGNERSSVHLRNSDLNTLHILLQQLQDDLSPPIRIAATDLLFEILDRHRAKWRRTLDELRDELDALGRSAAAENKVAASLPKKFTSDETAVGADKAARRRAALAKIDVETELEFRQYAATLENLVSLRRDTFDARKWDIRNLIAHGAMGDANTVHQLQNYVAGLSPDGLVVRPDGKLDAGRSFARINYFELLKEQRVRNNVQTGVSNRPVDFVAVRVPTESLREIWHGGEGLTEDAIWLYAGKDKQALLVLKTDPAGSVSYRYIPVTDLVQDASGTTRFQKVPVSHGQPLRYFEDDGFGVPVSRRAEWLGDWHTEQEWFEAVHRTKYSNAVIGLAEQLITHPVQVIQIGDSDSDTALIGRFRQRQRQLVQPDLLILANDHWNFDVRGFNPGGNHGSFFRVSTNSTFMIAGGAQTGIPRGLSILKPYDSLSVVPTVFRLMGKTDEKNRPDQDLADRGFRAFPGRVIREITGDK